MLVATGQGFTGADWQSSLSAWAVALILTLPAYVLRWLGAGDVKMLTALGLMTGLSFMLITYLIASVILVSVVVGWLLLQRFVPYLNLQLMKFNKSTYAMPVLTGKQLPFGAMIAVGGLLVVLLQWFNPNLLAVS